MQTYEGKTQTGWVALLLERLRSLATRTHGSPGGAVDCAGCGGWVDTTKALNPPGADGNSYEQRFPYPLPMERPHRSRCVVPDLEEIIQLLD
jgi:hypothetical protein